ncbi:MAG: hypothetical protein KJN92_07430, partial [Gemmatimonadetes bacterium]|nr:hypothetical protein [Gemmatimonadota bacterium]
MSKCRVTLGLAVGAGLIGCAEGPDPPVHEIRDSAGAEIVENARPLWRPEEVWSFGTAPMVRIGVMDGDRAYQFDQVVGALRLVDGTIVVADLGTREVRFFDPQGTMVSRFGGPGEGPGEFQGPTAIGKGLDDRIWLYDFMLRRITWLTATGELDGLTTLGPEPPMLHPIGVLADGGFLLKQLWGATQVAEATETGLRRDPVAFVVFDVDGILVDTLGLLPGREVLLTDEGGRGVMNTPPFAKNSVGAVWGEDVVVGATEAMDLAVMGPEWRTKRKIRIPGLDLTLTREHREAYVSHRLEEVPEEDRPGERARLESMPFPETRPAFGDLLADEVGNLWVAEAVLVPKTPKEWKVFDGSGRWL